MPCSWSVSSHAFLQSAPLAAFFIWLTSHPAKIGARPEGMVRTAEQVPSWGFQAMPGVWVQCHTCILATVSTQQFLHCSRNRLWECRQSSLMDAPWEGGVVACSSQVGTIVSLVTHRPCVQAVPKGISNNAQEREVPGKPLFSGWNLMVAVVGWDKPCLLQALYLGTIFPGIRRRGWWVQAVQRGWEGSEEMRDETDRDTHHLSQGWCLSGHTSLRLFLGSEGVKSYKEWWVIH